MAADDIKNYEPKSEQNAADFRASQRDAATNLEEAFDHARDLLVSRPYHDIALSPPGFDARASEKQSISTRDILGDTLSGEPTEQD